jgi:hypothetical protein
VIRKPKSTKVKRSKGKTCFSSCYIFPHRYGGGNCQFMDDKRYKDGTLINDLPPSVPDDEFPF